MIRRTLGVAGVATAIAGVALVALSLAPDTSDTAHGQQATVTPTAAAATNTPPAATATPGTPVATATRSATAVATGTTTAATAVATTSVATGTPAGGSQPVAAPDTGTGDSVGGSGSSAWVLAIGAALAVIGSGVAAFGLRKRA